MEPNFKAELRRQLLKQRRSLSARVWQTRSKQLCDRLQEFPIFARSTTILAYWSCHQEPDLSPLLSRSDKVWGLPRCVDKSLCWHHWKPGEALERGSYGIFEPHADSPRLQAESIDLILVPAVACDRAGYRLGYGGGFYDRLLSLPQWSSIPTLGIVFEFALLESLPVEPWDIALNGVCTEEQILKIAL
ncbi:5-formyltetrahydrofolate cyclo-ligase [Oscillatoria sp. FACHB-1406]|uniref:5-formyltetrahydrofolate cyclo-ligase n=1 Tax=Oscillatoria sp. FACHB-1406 TaxID=2692846 RepID=UPI0016835A76|nr:5-formyltetrahydrofolate cyclo-ligase [Oscillatoria sp. FACHB-1406]MBD2576337.1 5-formyltetrahydrofolate cyclo-ligase [Oscillatoria sp. FACHB-1406]